MVRVLGMASGPGFNVLLGNVHGTILGIPVNNLNAVGLLLVGANILAIITIFSLLEEPKVDLSIHHHHSSNEKDETPDQANGRWETLRSVMSLEILVPIVSIFSFNASFQL